MPNTSSHTSNLEPDALQSAAVLLPWLINDSLEGDEAEAVLSALESGDVAGELAATGEMFWLTGQHVPSLALAEYALDLPLSELSREEIELHLEGCAACRAEMALIASENVEEDVAPIEIAPVLDFATAPRRPATVSPAAPSRPLWRRYALAATLAATVVGALLVQVGGQLESPVVGLQDVAQMNVEESANLTEEILRNPTPETALFTDGFESGDTGSWSIVSN